MAVKLIALVFFALTAFPAHAREHFVSPVVEAVYYGRHAPAVLYGCTIGAQDGFALGLCFMYGHTAGGENRLAMMELQFLARFYIFGFNSMKGPFVQIAAGPVLFFEEGNVKIPAEAGVFSAGVTVGWRFLIGRRFFIDPYIRGGYPFLYGGGLSAGFRF